MARQPVSRVKFSQYNGGDALPAIHIGVEPDTDLAAVDAQYNNALMIHVQAYQLDDREAVATMLRAVADTIMVEGMLAGELGSLEVPSEKRQEVEGRFTEPERPSDGWKALHAPPRQPFNPQPRA
jgi:hypothetical protein